MSGDHQAVQKFEKEEQAKELEKKASEFSAAKAGVGNAPIPTGSTHSPNSMLSSAQAASCAQ